MGPYHPSPPIPNIPQSTPGPATNHTTASITSQPPWKAIGDQSPRRPTPTSTSAP